ncbi:hypothetical protein BY996DRAFT_6613295 [Phakopsora pachyrhizi]|nr:hypothetical protein BY996DRAFT_6613295 [Phakopsora pachyrhizi]
MSNTDIRVAGLRQEGRMGLSTQQMMRLASFPKSTLVGAVHRLERGRSHTRTPTGLWLSQPSDPDRLTAATGAQAEVESGPVTVTSGGWRWD